MKIFAVTLLLFASVISVLHGQGESPKPDRARHLDLGISVKGTSISALGISVDYFLSPSLNAEIHGTVALTAGGGGGFSYQLKGMDKIKRWSPFAGLSGGVYTLRFLTRTDYKVLYIPVGINYYSACSSFFFSADIGPSIQWIDDYHQGDYNPYKEETLLVPMVTLRAGLRF